MEKDAVKDLRSKKKVQELPELSIYFGLNRLTSALCAIIPYQGNSISIF